MKGEQLLRIPGTEHGSIKVKLGADFVVAPMVHTDDTRMAFTKSCANEQTRRESVCTRHELMVLHATEKQKRAYKDAPRLYGDAAELLPARRKRGIQFGFAARRLCCGALS